MVSAVGGSVRMPRTVVLGLCERVQSGGRHHTSSLNRGNILQRIKIGVKLGSEIIEKGETILRCPAVYKGPKGRDGSTKRGA